MRRVQQTVFACLIVLLFPGVSWAKLDPLRVITERLDRSEIIIVLDTSQTMGLHASPALARGADCGGDENGLRDLCGDGQCTGTEGGFMNACYQDCNLGIPGSTKAGSPPMCTPNQTPLMSRMYMLKRVLRNMLPDMKKSAAFGLITYNQNGYYRYYQGLTPTATNPAKLVTVWWSRFEMEKMGAWDATNLKPRKNFTWNGTKYSLLSEAGLQETRDSLYGRSDNYFEERRWKYSTGGMLHSDGQYNWLYRGSYYTYLQVPRTHSASLISSNYKGPQFKQAGTTWGHNRFYHPATAQGITASTTGLVVESLEPSDTQLLQETKLYKIMTRLNLARNGGLWPRGGTASGPGIWSAMFHYIDRQFGNGVFASVGGDPNVVCRNRFILVLTDGQSSASMSPYTAAHFTYVISNILTPGNPIKTVVVGVPGLSSSAVSQLDLIADYGDNGLADLSTVALTSSNETELSNNIKDALMSMVKGDFTTTSAGTATSSASNILGNVALIPSTEYPGWRGHLRAMDITTSPATELWDAALELNSMEYKNRKIFTGFPDTNSTIPVPLLATDGTVNLNGGCSGCGGIGVKSVWQDAVKPTTAPSDNNIISTVEWVAGKGKTWRLGPLFRSAPAVVGPPPKYFVSNHSNFRGMHAAREKLVYIPSNDGIIHAFRLKDGTEAFGFVPPQLWTKIHALWQRGGQSPVPDNFRWIMAASPRVEDQPENCTPCEWKTHLMQVMGPGDNSWIALDISSPSACTATTCNLKLPPLKVLAHSRDMKPGIDSVMGETWSIPAIFYDYPSTYPEPRMAMGSGYWSDSRSDYYMYHDSIYQTLTSKKQNGGGAEVEYALLPNTTAVVDYDQDRKILATYQADPSGNLKRYDRGEPNSGSNIIASGTSKPFFYSPAAWHKGSGEVLLAAITGAQDENAPPSGEVSTIYLRSETGGSVNTDDYLQCDVDDLCSGLGDCPDDVPTSCTGPGPTAKPVGQPLILRNEDGATQQYEAFYVLYEPPAVSCQIGTSWLLRVSTSGSTQKLISATQFAKTRATGMTVVGGGLDVVITAAGFGTGKSSVKALLNKINSGNILDDLPYVEVWREVK